MTVFDIEPLHAVTMMRNIYDDCDEGGKTVFESTDEKAVEEIQSIAQELERA